MKRIGHKSLKASILDACNLFCALEVTFSRVAPFLSLSCIVNQILQYFSQRSSLLSKINDDPATSLLCGLDAFLDSMSQIRSTSTDVAPKNITAVAFVVDAACEFDIFIRDRVWITPDINGQTTNRREKNLNIGTRDQLGIHSIGHTENRTTQVRLGSSK